MRRHSEPHTRPAAVRLTPAEMEKMRAVGRFTAWLLDQIEGLIQPGVATSEIDRFVAAETRKRGGRDAPLGYRAPGAPPFPGHCCTSVNQVVCHGIPSDAEILREGDLVNVDVTPILDGFHGDSSRTYLVGECHADVRRLVESARTAMWRGIAAVRPGATVGDIGHAIQTYAEGRGYAVVREFAGHGVGRVFHGPPTIAHYGRAGTGPPLLPGMTFTIEPMINMGDWRCRLLADGWTVVTADGSLSAQFEHTVAVTPGGVEVLTRAEGERLELAPA